MPVRETGFRKRGRPSAAGAEVTPSERTALWRNSLRASGGKSICVNMGPETRKALERLAPPRERGPLIERLILDELRRRERAGAQLAKVESTPGTDGPALALDARILPND